METESFAEDQLCRKRTINPMDNNGEEMQPPTLRELLKTQVNDRTYMQLALTIGLWKSVSMFDVEATLGQISSVDGASQRYIQATLQP